MTDPDRIVAETVAIETVRADLVVRGYVTRARLDALAQEIAAGAPTDPEAERVALAWLVERAKELAAERGIRDWLRGEPVL